MKSHVQRWFRTNTHVASDFSAPHLLDAKGHSTIAVVLPALNEAATIGPIIDAARTLVGERDPLTGRGLIDDLVVLDSGSTDHTAEVARAHGARVVRRDDVLAHIPTVPGKGEAMWRALVATDTDIVVFIDADLRSFTPAYLTGLLGPLLTNPEVHLVKAMYERPLHSHDGQTSAGGGRVTELVARPVLNLHWPDLAGIVQPLAGEYAARRTLLEQIAFPCGYGVEMAILLDTWRLHGLAAIAQVDLGVRVHRHHDERKLGLMASEIWQTVLARLDPTGVILRPNGLEATLAQFDRRGNGFAITTHDVAVLVRPPLREIPEYVVAHERRP